MPKETSDETATAYAYPPKHVYEEWKDEAEEMDMAVSEYVQAMTEAGRKKFDADVRPDESAAELREQRNDLRRENERLRDRIGKLEDQLHTGERGKIIEYVQNNPGVDYHDILQELGDTVADRAPRVLDELEGQKVERIDGDYYPITEREDDE
jgi:predicted nuclease with TOPRIM domain